MSRIVEVIKNKNKIERSHKARRKEELTRIRGKAAYKAAINDELRYIDTLLMCNGVNGVIIKVSEKQLARFSEAIYSEVLSGYDIEQVSGEPDKFIVRLKTI